MVYLCDFIKMDITAAEKVEVESGWMSQVTVLAVLHIPHGQITAEHCSRFHVT